MIYSLRGERRIAAQSKSPLSLEDSSVTEHDRVYVAGHCGLVGAALVRRLLAKGVKGLVLRTHDEMDLTDADAVERFFQAARPNLVFLAAAKVGGILANSKCPAEFIRENLLIQTNVIDAAYRQGVRKLLFLGSSCVYPKHAVQPIVEDSLLTGALEPTNSAYAVAKLAGLEMCAAYRRQFGFNTICLMPTNLYGPNDNFDPVSSHVLPGLIRRIHEARVRREQEVVIWGTGLPRREFMHVDDLADAAVHLMETYDELQIINVGVGRDISISELATLIASIVGYEGQIRFDTKMPDGTPRKLLDVSRLRQLGWRHQIPLSEGIRQTYRWFVDNAGVLN